MKYLAALIAVLVLAACTTAAPTASATAAASHSTVAATPRASPAGGSTAPSASGGYAEDAQSCTNEDVGFTVDYPAEWWANKTIEPTFEGGTPIAACTYFGPDEVELRPNAGLPQGIAIWFDVETQFQVTGEELSSEEAEIDGRQAVVLETEATGSGGFEPAGTRSYRYIVGMDDGSQLLVATSTLYIGEAEYEDTKGILDWMMETLDLDD